MTQQHTVQKSQAVCITNSFGRLLGANRRFCRMFGLDQDEVIWRYLHDFHRRINDWEHFRSNLERYGDVHAAMLRLKHRKGRSFLCMVSSTRFVSAEGKVCYRMYIQKLAPNAVAVQQKVKQPDSSDTVVYLMVCHGCGLVKASDGRWIRPERPVSVTSRKVHYCPECSQAMFPEVMLAAHR